MLTKYIIRCFVVETYIYISVVLSVSAFRLFSSLLKIERDSSRFFFRCEEYGKILLIKTGRLLTIIYSKNLTILISIFLLFVTRRDGFSL